MHKASTQVFIRMGALFKIQKYENIKKSSSG